MDIKRSVNVGPLNAHTHTHRSLKHHNIMARAHIHIFKHTDTNSLPVQQFGVTLTRNQHVKADMFLKEEDIRFFYCNGALTHETCTAAASTQHGFTDNVIHGP